MASKVTIGGTNYDVKGGKTTIGGTGYSIKKGKTLVNGTNYTISLKRTVTISDSFTPATTVSGTPVYNYTISSDRKSITITMTSQKSTNEAMLDRNNYTVAIHTVKSGETVSFLGTNIYPPATCECGVVTQGGVVVKNWEKYGTNVTYSFTSTADGPIYMTLTDGDFDSQATTISFTLSNLTINGELIYF